MGFHEFIWEDKFNNFEHHKFILSISFKVRASIITFKPMDDGGQKPLPKAIRSRAVGKLSVLVHPVNLR